MTRIILAWIAALTTVTLVYAGGISGPPVCLTATDVWSIYPGARLMGSLSAPRLACQRARWDSAMGALPSTDLGLLDIPPWNLHPFLPTTGLALHGCPFRVLAPQW